MKRIFFFLLTFFAVCPSVGAQPPWRGDMFTNKPWNTFDRPAVSSDFARGQDMFPRLPPYWRPEADMFDRVRFVQVYREDMFRRHPLRPSPDTPLFRGYSNR